jgi:endonuclease-8
MEGPSLVILAEDLQAFAGQTILAVDGNTKIAKERLNGLTLQSIRSWGKHLLLDCGSLSIRIHFLMFGSFRINERKEGRIPRLSLEFLNGEINFYSCSVRFIEAPLDSIYDWKADIMSPSWDGIRALKRIRQFPDAYVCDILMAQDIFAGLGNIIKNEVLFNLKLHPLSKVSALPRGMLKKMVQEARDYSLKFYAWKKEFQLKKHWLIYKKRMCPRCALPVELQKTGVGQRRSFFCNSCQKIFNNPILLT